MSKGKTIQPKFAVVLALAVVLVLIWYGYKAEWFKDVGVENTGAVAAVSSTDKPAKGASAGISSGKPTIAVTSWPTFEMKYNGAGQENNLVVKAEYSITATTKKIFIPATWGNLWIRNTAYQGANPTKIEVKSLDALSLTNCNYVGSCYVIPSGKTVRFVVRQVYNPLVMFGGLYSGQLSYLHYLTDSSNGNFYYTQFPAQTSKLNTITVVGEKSPYVYTTVASAVSGQPFTLKGVRFTGATLLMGDGSTPANIISRSDTEITLSLITKETPTVYTLYFKHPTYGESNRAQITVTVPSPLAKTLYPNGGETISLKDSFVVSFKPVVGSPHYIYLVDWLNLSSPMLLTPQPIIGQATDKQITVINKSLLDSLNIKPGNKFKIETCTSLGSRCDESDGFFTIEKPVTLGQPLITFVSSDESVNVRDGADNDTGTFTLTYRVEAVGGPVYMSDISKAIGTTTPATVSDSQGVLYVIEKNGVPQLSGSQSIVTFTTSGGASDAGVTNGVRLDEGEEANFTLTVIRTNTGNSSDDGLYRVSLKGVGWNTTDKYGFSIYRDLIDYKTDPVSIN